MERREVFTAMNQKLAPDHWQSVTSTFGTDSSKTADFVHIIQLKEPSRNWWIYPLNVVFAYQELGGAQGAKRLALQKEVDRQSAELRKTSIWVWNKDLVTTA
jgi:hypothetical protein